MNVIKTSESFYFRLVFAWWRHSAFVVFIASEKRRIGAAIFGAARAVPLSVLRQWNPFSACASKSARAYVGRDAADWLVIRKPLWAYIPYMVMSRLRGTSRQTIWVRCSVEAQRVGVEMREDLLHWVLRLCVELNTDLFLHILYGNIYKKGRFDFFFYIMNDFNIFKNLFCFEIYFYIKKIHLKVLTKLVIIICTMSCN